MFSLAIILAALPAILLVIYVYKKDKNEKEPKGLLAKLIGFGMLSIIPAVIIELVGNLVLGIFLRPDSILFIFIDCFVIIAGAEEGSKFLMLKLGSWKNREFNFSFDGVVYSVCTGLGFALLENIMYVIGGGLRLAFSRALTAVMAHAVFGVIMGVFYGRARQFQTLGNIKKRNQSFARAIIFPLLLHGLYDFLLSVNSVLTLIVFLVVLIGIYVLMFSVVRKASKNDAPAVPVYYIPNSNAVPGQPMPGQVVQPYQQGQQMQAQVVQPGNVNPYSVGTSQVFPQYQPGAQPQVQPQPQFQPGQEQAMKDFYDEPKN